MPNKSNHFFADREFEFTALLLIGTTYYRGADVGQVLRAFKQIRNGHREDWYEAFAPLAKRIHAIAIEAEQKGHRQSAADAYSRAATYYIAACRFLNSPEKRTDALELWKNHRQCWENAARLFPVPGVKIYIPYEGKFLEGYFFDNAHQKNNVPLIIFNNGADGPISSMHWFGGAAALERGYSILYFDGPGQGEALWNQNIPFRFDWEKVLAPVIDFSLTLPNINAERIGMVGISQGGYFVSRALAFEKRIKAAAVDPGVVDVSAAFRNSAPGFIQKMILGGNKERADYFMSVATRFSSRIREVLDFRMRPYGQTSPFETYHEMAKYQITPSLAAKISCQMLITDPDREYFWPNQPQALYDLLRCPKKILRFTTEEGADWHCEPAGLGLRAQRIFDWFDEIL
jgi:pimeloyl-ACP methyl ester carboxylesterase